MIANFQDSPEEGSISDRLNYFWHPQLVSLILLTAILCVFAVVVYRRAIKQPKDRAPEGLLLVAEAYVMGVEKIFREGTDGKISKPAPYIFTLITFLAVGNLMGLIGFEVPVTSYSVPFTLAIISWVGIYVVGVTYQKAKFFKRYLNPLEVIGAFTPVISLSFRIFGNIIGGSTIMYLVYYFTGWIWSFIPVVGELNILGGILAPAFHIYFDIFGGLVQAYVFTLLTMVYWSQEAEVPAVKKKKKKKKNKKQAIQA